MTPAPDTSMMSRVTSHSRADDHPPSTLGRQLGQDARQPVAWHSAVDPVGSTGSAPAGFHILGFPVLHRPPPGSGGKNVAGSGPTASGPDRDPRRVDCTADVHCTKPLLPPVPCHRNVGTTRRRDRDRDRAPECRGTDAHGEGRPRARRARGARGVGAGAGPARSGRVARGAEPTPRARPRAGPSRSHDGLAVHVLPGRGEDHGGRPEGHADGRPGRPALRRRAPLELRRVRVAGADAGVRPERLRRDASRARSSTT